MSESQVFLNPNREYSDEEMLKFAEAEYWNLMGAHSQGKIAKAPKKTAQYQTMYYPQACYLPQHPAQHPPTTLLSGPSPISPLPPQSLAALFQGQQPMTPLPPQSLIPQPLTPLPRGLQ
ncbi:hypothetical protein FN846DRAFT_919343 [Sphaerosporella brunnea]|uniref:Uncharacterized protein n=1 Tax=Sphaerosporella brunnea TaxID=1250544 RepID=A0A5J5EXD6_9PEZI|nr:hypothetical protein FN846DRAFT_919343 [Sphaerosporella brunnea]